MQKRDRWGETRRGSTRRTEPENSVSKQTCALLHRRLKEKCYAPVPPKQAKEHLCIERFAYEMSPTPPSALRIIIFFPLQEGERLAKTTKIIFSWRCCCCPLFASSRRDGNRRLTPYICSVFTTKKKKTTHLLPPSTVCKPNSILIRPDAAVCWARQWCNGVAGKYR